jgi:GTP pyrophosphokinase
MQKIDYALARCCTPIPGDDVFGFLTVTEGIKVHRSSCPNAKQLLSSYGNRVIKAMWISQIQKSYLATITLEGIDRVGMIQDLTKVISNELHINMRSLNIDTNEQIFHGDIKVYVTDTKHLDKLLRHLKNIEGINKVLRQERLEEELLIP